MSLTEKAAEKFKKLADEAGCGGAALRVGVLGGGCSGFTYHVAFEQNQPQDTDSVFECFGVRVVVDQMSMMYLAGMEIDYAESLAGAGFVFKSPNIKHTCGCGKSFEA